MSRGKHQYRQMEIELDKDAKISLLASLRSYSRQELDMELSEMRALV